MFHVGRSVWAMLAFLVGFTVLITVVSHYFLIPAMVATGEATEQERQRISALASLLLAVVIVILCVGLIMVFRIRRYFFPSSRPQQKMTQYIDAWSEAGKRARGPDPDAK